MPTKKYYTINPSWDKGCRPDLVSQAVIFGEDTEDTKTDSCIAIYWFPGGPRLDADFNEWSLLSRERTLLDLLAGAGLTHGKNLTVAQVIEILEVCGFEEEKCVPSNPLTYPELLAHDPRVGKLARSKGTADKPMPIKWVRKYPNGREEMRIAAEGWGIEAPSSEFEIIE